jgi:hypothetical protein
MKLKKAIEQIVLNDLPKEKKRFLESLELMEDMDQGVDYEDLLKDHRYHALYRLKIGLERGEFNNHMAP